MTAPTRTFSGAHPYRPQCVLNAARKVFDETLPDAAAELAVVVAERTTADISNGFCPRCHDPLLPDPKPEDWRPAGSRATICRCIPVCDRCASWIEPVLGTSPVTAWPTDTDIDDDGVASRKEHEAERVEHAKAQATVGFLEVGPDGAVLVTPDGAVPFRVVPRPHPGGWLEHGYDDTDDRMERGR